VIVHESTSDRLQVKKRSSARSTSDRLQGKQAIICKINKWSSARSTSDLLQGQQVIFCKINKWLSARSTSDLLQGQQVIVYKVNKWLSTRSTSDRLQGQLGRLVTTTSMLYSNSCLYLQQSMLCGKETIYQIPSKPKPTRKSNPNPNQICILHELPLHLSSMPISDTLFT